MYTCVLASFYQNFYANSAIPQLCGTPESKYTQPGEGLQSTQYFEVKSGLVSGERPFECISCSFGFYKKSDLTRHQKGMGCSGAKFRCSTCSKPFHFKRQLEEHLVWSQVKRQLAKHPFLWTHRDELQSCGVMDFAEDEESKAGPSRYMNPEERPSIARFNISRDHSVSECFCVILVPLSPRSGRPGQSLQIQYLTCTEEDRLWPSVEYIGLVNAFLRVSTDNFAYTSGCPIISRTYFWLTLISGVPTMLTTCSANSA